MFSGIIETVGRIMKIACDQGCKHVTITPALPFDDLKIGDSISINGVCLTVTHFSENTFDVTIVPETLRLTNLDHLTINDCVNLERSLKLGDRIGGHYVQGHVDGMGEILELDDDHGAALLVKISLPQPLSPYVIKKGFIALDGMSITVIHATPEWFTVTFIPHTQAVTITNQYKKGACINIEIDMMGKHIHKMIGAYTHAISN
jgi:riboflavin synthase